MRWRTFLVASLIATASSRAAETTTPRLTRTATGVEIVLPTSILRAGDVTKHLRSGLTTAFVAKIDERNVRGALRIEVRYELWDELYLVNTLEADGRRQRLTMASLEKLAEWWGRTPLRIVHAREAPKKMEVRLEMVPFSAREEADAQKWLAQSIGGAPEPRSQSSPPNEPSGGILDLIIGTSVQRRPIRSWKWNIPIDTGAR